MSGRLNFFLDIWRSKKALRLVTYIIIFIVLAGVGAVGVSETYVARSSKGRMFDSIEGLPSASAALILGCSPHLADGRVNHYFKNRIKAGSELWKSGKVKAIIVSGDNGRHTYNEPDAMKESLVEQGVPADRIVCDYAGFRTLDSVVRAREIFGAESLIIVSQEYHNSRAMAIARYNDIPAYAYNAENIYSRAYRLKSWMRERAARVAMMLDLWVLDTSPKYLGEKENLPH